MVCMLPVARYAERCREGFLGHIWPLMVPSAELPGRFLKLHMVVYGPFYCAAGRLSDTTYEDETVRGG